MNLRPKKRLDYNEIPKAKRRGLKSTSERCSDSSIKSFRREEVQVVEKLVSREEEASPQVDMAMKIEYTVDPDRQADDLMELKTVIPYCDEGSEIVKGVYVPMNNPKDGPEFEVLESALLNITSASVDKGNVGLLTHCRQAHKRRAIRTTSLREAVFGLGALIVFGVCVFIVSKYLQGGEVIGENPGGHPVIPEGVYPQHSSTPLPTISIVVNLRGFICTYGTVEGSICVSLGRGICVRIGEHAGRKPFAVRVREHAEFKIDVCANFRCFEEV